MKRPLARSIAALVFVVPLSVTALTAPSNAATVGSSSESALQQEIDTQLAQYPGGIQVSDNAVAYQQGAVVLVFPNPGQSVAPDGLGPNPRVDQARALGLLAQTPSNSLSATSSGTITPYSTAYLHGCPYSTITNADWYCFYTDINWGGRRLEFKDTAADFAGNWGFDNQTTSWVNTNHTFSIYTYSVACNSTLPWIEPSGPASSSYVGSTDNDRLSFWSKSIC